MAITSPLFSPAFMNVFTKRAAKSGFVVVLLDDKLPKVVVRGVYSSPINLVRLGSVTLFICSPFFIL